MPLEKAKIAFIDTRKPVWGVSPEPIRGKLKPALDSTGLPYFIWSTLQGNVTAKQLGALQYVVWNSGGSLSAKDVGILGGYFNRSAMDGQCAFCISQIDTLDGG